MALKAVLFDLDGVVTDTAGLHAAAWRAMATELGWRFDEDLTDALRGVPRLEALDIVAARNGASLSPERAAALAERKNRLYVDSLAGLGPGDILPGIAELLRSLGAEGIPAALASASRNAPAILDRLGMRPWFAALADPSLVPGKPHPGIFLQCAKLLGVLPGDCLGIEDAQVGIDAIRAAGMTAVGVGPRLTGADLVVESTAELSLLLLKEAAAGRGRARP